MRLLRLPVVLTTAVALTACPALTAGAAGIPTGADQTRAEHARVEQDIAELSADLAGTSAELTGAYTDLAAGQERVRQARADLDRALAAQARAESEDAALAARLAAAEQAQALAEQELAANQARIEQNRAELGRLASAAYRRGAVHGELAVVLQSQSPQQLADRVTLSGSVMSNRAAAISELNRTRSRQDQAVRRLDAVRAQVADLRDQARRSLAAAQAARAGAQAAKSELDALVASQAATVERIRARKAEEDARLADLQRERDAIAAQLRQIADQDRAERLRQARQRTGQDPAAGSPDPAPHADPVPTVPGGRLSRPVQTRVTSSYGYRIHPIYGYQRMHAGTDFGGPCGTPVRAAADGRIVSAGWAGGYGNRVVIAHGVLGGESVGTSYAHLSRIERSSGQVRRGDVIGLVGTTGASTGCHLHFEVYLDGSHTDPMGWL